MTLDNMTGITEGSYTGFCKSQLITCHFVKACNGVCPFEDALKHADKEMDKQTVINHDRDWIIGCIQHDGFIHTHRFDKANQIIIDALSADTSSDLISRANAIRWVKTECNPYGKPTLDYDSGLKVIEHLKKMPSALPSAEPKTDEENELKFYYVESIDDYWVGRRLDNFYYANWHKGLGFIWSHSRYLPWGEHIVDENTLWKEHTYPSEPIEIPFPEWVVGFVKKYFTEPKTGEWIPCSERLPKRDELVLVTYKTTDRIHLCRYIDDGSENPWWSYIDDCCAWNNVVLAWMPLPKPYREDDEV